MPEQFKSSIVRIYSKNDTVRGAGFLVSQKYILTCAHVVASALGLPIETTEIPDAEITLDFPYTETTQKFKAKVVFWLPMNPDKQAEDIAGLELENSPSVSPKVPFVLAITLLEI